jgi:hypothetical protein
MELAGAKQKCGPQAASAACNAPRRPRAMQWSGLADDLRTLVINPAHEAEGSVPSADPAIHRIGVPIPQSQKAAATPESRQPVRKKRSKGSTGTAPRVSSYLLARFNREELYDDVWTSPMGKIAPKWGVAASYLSAVCQKLHIPVPGPGYWNKVAAGKPVATRPNMPSVEGRPTKSALLARIDPATQEQRIIPRLLADRYDRERLYEEVWNTPLEKLAKEYGKSGRDLGALCRRLFVPLPSLGYWNKLVDRRRDEVRPPLPVVKIKGVKDLVPPPDLVSTEPRIQLRISEKLTTRYDRNELYEQAWKVPMRVLAKEYGISDVALAKRCRKLSIPVPGRGYWAKKTSNQPVAARPPLTEVRFC